MDPIDDMGIENYKLEEYINKRKNLSKKYEELNVDAVILIIKLSLLKLNVE